jgi:hypothetical protein
VISLFLILWFPETEIVIIRLVGKTVQEKRKHQLLRMWREDKLYWPRLGDTLIFPGYCRFLWLNNTSKIYNIKIEYKASLCAHKIIHLVSHNDSPKCHTLTHLVPYKDAFLFTLCHTMIPFFANNDSPGAIQWLSSYRYLFNVIPYDLTSAIEWLTNHSTGAYQWLILCHTSYNYSLTYKGSSCLTMTHTVP